MYAYKVVIHPNNKQETRIRRTLNKVIECNNIIYDYLDGFIKRNEKIPKCKDVRKWFTEQKQIYDDALLKQREGLTKKEIREKNLDTLFYDVSNDALKQEIKDTYGAFMKFFKKEAEYPVRKEYTSYRKSFYIDPYKIRFTSNKVRLEKIANNQKPNRQKLNYISLAEKDRIPVDVKYENPRVVYEHGRFYITVSVKEGPVKDKYNVPLTNEVIGIDLNIKEIVTSDNDRFLSVTKNKRYIKASKKLKRASRKLSGKRIFCKELKKKVKDRKNYYKQLKIKRRCQARVNNLKVAHDDELITTLIHKLPKSINIEDLDIKGMQASDKKEAKYIRRGIQQNGWGKLIQKLKEKCNKYEIEVLEINRWYPSSKKCHQCGTIKKDLKLYERTYKCLSCGLVINRDLNAAINIRNYSIL